MDRIGIAQQWIDRHSLKNYLEIGCRSGLSLLRVKANTKIAVDPQFAIPVKTKIKWSLLNPSNLRLKYFEMTSDQFFAGNRAVLDRYPIGVALIDGLHTYRQALVDVLNILPYLVDSGLIVMHDCYPPNAAAATPAESPAEAQKAAAESWTNEWCGDTWKAVMYLREFVPEVKAIVLNCDYGLGIVRKRHPGKIVPKLEKASFEKLLRHQYKEMIERQKDWIGLCDTASFSQMLNDG